ncbi:MAG: alginate lyase family protein, partial [Bryobacteraceae bacterium]
NFYFFLRKPAPKIEAEAPLPGLPDVQVTIDRLRGTAFAEELLRLAGQILNHRFPLLGIEVATGPEIAWRRDYASGRETEARYFRRIPYLDSARVGDHKVIWELNRHQHLVLLAQAFRLSGRSEFASEIRKQLESWIEQNPFQRGINWTSALEVAFRALSWIWIFHLAGPEMPESFRKHFLQVLYQHGCHLEYNLSRYFSRNTHLLGEAAALHALGALFPEFPGAARWKQTGAAQMRAELDYQVRPDGAYFEQSTYYHVYALDMFLFHYLVAGRPADFAPVLNRMAAYLDVFSGSARLNPYLGDDDGGRLFHPYGQHAEYGRATVATSMVLFYRGASSLNREDLYPQAVWWLGEEAWQARPLTKPAGAQSRLFRDSGLCVMEAGGHQVLVDAGLFGAGRGGHSHSDTLTIIARSGTEEILIDAGTYTYVGDAQWRNRFRGSAAHNILRVNGQDQAEPAGPFGWLSKPSVTVREWTTTARQDLLDAECTYSGIIHRRRILFLKPKLLFVLDQALGPAGEHLIEQFWHPGQPVSMITPACYRIGSQALITFDGRNPVTCGEGGEYGWRSRALGKKEPAPYLCAAVRRSLPALFATVLEFTASTGASLSIQQTGSELVLQYRSGAT